MYKYVLAHLLILAQLDYEEFKEIEQLCNSHPAVLNEIEKLKLPAG